MRSSRWRASRSAGALAAGAVGERGEQVDRLLGRGGERARHLAAEDQEIGDAARA